MAIATPKSSAENVATATCRCLSGDLCFRTKQKFAPGGRIAPSLTTPKMSLLVPLPKKTFKGTSKDDLSSTIITKTTTLIRR